MGYFDERADWCLERNLCPQCDCDYLGIRLVDNVCPRCGYICETHKDIGKARKPVCGECERLREENERLKIMVYDLRGYTRDWDWKYGKEWDEEMEALGMGNSTEVVEIEENE